MNKFQIAKNTSISIFFFYIFFFFPLLVEGADCLKYVGSLSTGEVWQECQSGCDSCDASGNRTCCNGGNPPNCNSSLESCTEDDDDGGGGGGASPQPWTIQGRKVIYKETGAFSAVQAMNMLLRKTDDSATANTTGDSAGVFSVTKLNPSGGGAQIDILNGTYEAGIAKPSNWAVFSTLCANGTTCHTNDSTRTGNPVGLTLGNNGGYADLYWHFVGPPTNLQVQCNSTGTQATLSWTSGSGISFNPVRAIRSDQAPLVCDPNSTGPISICRNVTGNSYTMNVTPYYTYGWWLNQEHYPEAIAGSAFTCGAAPTGTIYIAESTCEALPGKYPINEPIDFHVAVGGQSGLGSSKTYIAKECGATLCTYTTGNTPTWCSSSGGTMDFSSGSTAFCSISSQTYSGTAATQSYFPDWTPNAVGVYYAVINAVSTNSSVFACSGNPLCEYSDSPLTKYAGTACANGRFRSCQTGSNEGKMGVPENNDLWGESIRFEVVAAASCDPLPICGEVRSSTGTTLGGQSVTIVSGAVTRNKTTLSTPVVQRGSFSHIEFFPGSGYSVTLNSAPPAGDYAPAVTSYPSQTLGGSTDCSVSCGCDFQYRSCYQISDIALDTTNAIQFTPQPGGYQPVTISWTQNTAGGVGTSFAISMRAGSATGTETTIDPATVTSSISGANTRFSATISSAKLAELRANLLTANSNDVYITVSGSRFADPYCNTTGHAAITTSPTQTIDSTEQITLRVRQTPLMNSCPVASLSTVSEITGTLWASALGYPSLIPDVAPPSNSDKTAIVPTGATITANYRFSSDLFECTTSTSCNTLPTDNTGDPTKICKTSAKADANGNVTLYVYRWDIDSWWEASGGMVYGANSVISPLPLDSDGDPILCSTDNRCAPWLVRSSNFTPNLLAGLPISKTITAGSGWFSERIQGSAPNQKFNQSASGGGTALDGIGTVLSGNPYAYLRNLVASKATISSSAPTVTTTLPTASGFYQLGVDGSNTHTVSPSTTQIVPSGRALVFFVNGNLVINRALSGSNETLISVNQGGFIAYIVTGTITIDSDVGTTVWNGSMPTAANGIGLSTPPVANLTGVFVANGPIIIDDDGTIPDKRFIGAGSFISATGITMPRKYSYSGSAYSNYLSGFTPTELFRHRPDLVLNTPRELKEPVIQYKEIQ